MIPSPLEKIALIILIAIGLYRYFKREPEDPMEDPKKDPNKILEDMERKANLLMHVRTVLWTIAAVIIFAVVAGLAFFGK